jgi:4-hydroxybenzoate polyprenyltransferase
MGSYLLYFRERFPIPQTILLSVFVASAASVGTQVHIFGTITSLMSIGIAIVVFFLTLFVIRILDDFRDARFDDHYHPERPLQRGVLRLADLKAPLIVSVILCGVIALSGGPTSVALFCLAAAWVFVAYKDYFSDQLPKTFSLYMIALELQMVPILFLLYSLNGLRYESGNLYFAALTFFIVALVGCIEVGRKIRAPERETPARDTPISTYTAQYGITGASLTLGGIACLALVGYVLATPGSITMLEMLLMAVPAVLMAAAISSFVSRPTPKSDKTVFVSTCTFVALLIALFVASSIGIV